MEVNINEVVSNVRAVDSHSLLTPQVMQKIVHLVLEEVRNQEEYRQRVAWEQQTSVGVRHQLEEEYT